MSWKRVITRKANVLLKYLILSGMEEGCFVLPDWKGFKNQLWAWNNGETGIYYLEDELREFADFISNRATPELVHTYKVNGKVICDSGVTIIKSAASQVHSGLDNSELVALFNTFCKAFQCYGHTIIQPLEEVQDKILKAIVAENDLGRDSHELLSVLVTPSELSIEAQEQLDRLELLREAKTFKEEFLKDSANEIRESQPGFYGRLEDHVQRYCWIPLNFEKPLWDVQFFLNLLKKHLTDSSNFELRQKELASYFLFRNKEKSDLICSLRLDQKIWTLIELLSAGSYIRLYRATIYSLAFYESFPILREIGKRLGLDISILRYFTPPEIRKALLSGGRLDPNRGIARKNSFVILRINKRHSQYEGNAALQVMQKEIPNDRIEQTKCIRGKCAYPGKVSGKVRIISDARETRIIEKGNILVCKETNPDLVPKQASFFRLRCGGVGGFF